MVEFSELPEDTVNEVFRRLSDVEDCVRFPSVCKQWCSVASTDYDKERPRKPLSPWLMLATLKNDSQEGEEGGVRICYSFLGNKLFRLRLPELQGRKGWGTPHGWLLVLGLDMAFFLFHPFTRAKISLPSPHKFRRVLTRYENSHHVCEGFIRRVAISSNPSSHPNSVVVMVVYGGGNKISFASPGDDSWTHIKIPRAGPIDDVIFFNGSFYCLNIKGAIYVCDITDPLQPSTRLIAPHPKTLKRLTDHNSNFYLVEISGHLYLIRRKWRACEERGLDPGDISTLRHETLHFYAYEFDLHAKKWNHSAIKHFNGHAILVGNNTSCAISTVDHPELKPDCIYFTDDHVRFYRSKLGCYNDMGVYDFKNKVMMEPFYEITKSQWCSKFSRPFFFLPTLK